MCYCLGLHILILRLPKTKQDEGDTIAYIVVVKTEMTPVFYVVYCSKCIKKMFYFCF